MATIQEAQAEILKMQKEQDDRVEASKNEMKAFMTELVKTLKSGGGEAAEDKKTNDKDDQKNKDKIFDDKFIKKLKPFDGKQENYKNWLFKFKNALKIKNKQFHDILTETEEREHEWGTDLDEKLENNVQIGIELYEVLCDLFGALPLFRFSS